MSDRHTKHSHHSVADEFLDGSAVLGKYTADAVVSALKSAPGDLRVVVPHERRRSDNIGEKDGRELPLLWHRASLRALGRSITRASTGGLEGHITDVAQIARAFPRRTLLLEIQ
ncbi:MAG: hypothetical protein WEE03_06050 [Chloroflexota bacterium]